MLYVCYYIFSSLFTLSSSLFFSTSSSSIHFFLMYKKNENGKNLKYNGFLKKGLRILSLWCRNNNNMVLSVFFTFYSKVFFLLFVFILGSSIVLQHFFFVPEIKKKSISEAVSLNHYFVSCTLM